jgi:hypothetical protein
MANTRNSRWRGDCICLGSCMTTYNVICENLTCCLACISKPQLVPRHSHVAIGIATQDYIDRDWMIRMRTKKVSNVNVVVIVWLAMLVRGHAASCHFAAIPASRQRRHNRLVTVCCRLSLAVPDSRASSLRPSLLNRSTGWSANQLALPRSDAAVNNVGIGLSWSAPVH